MQVGIRMGVPLRARPVLLVCSCNCLILFLTNYILYHSKIISTNTYFSGTYAPGISIITAFYALTSNSSQQYIDCTVNMRAHVLSNRLAFQSFGSGNDAMSLTGICGDPFPGKNEIRLLPFYPYLG